MEGFEGKTALITGAAGGIGALNVPEALVESGCRVVLHDVPRRRRTGRKRRARSHEDLARGARSSPPAISATSRASNGRAKRSPPSSTVLTSSSTTRPSIRAPIEAYSLEEFLAVHTIHADAAAFVLCQTFAPYMRRKGGGGIVNVMSVILSGGWAEKVPYAMWKGALLGLTRLLARESVRKYPGQCGEPGGHSDRARAQALRR